MLIQSIYASRLDGFTSKKLLNWIRSHGFEPIKKIHNVSHIMRYRISEPIYGKRYITKVLSNGIHLVIMI